MEISSTGNRRFLIVRTVLRHIVARTYKPILEKYLSGTTYYRYKGIELEIAPEVFHPRFFFSTRFLLDHIRSLPLSGKKFLEPGCGSGLISVYAAKQHAIVTALDINPIAIEMLKKNSLINGTTITIVHSDLFEELPPQKFDIIAINPPYFKNDPVEIRDYAWQCGKNGEFFEKLFGGLREFILATSIVLMVLSENCDLLLINTIAGRNGFALRTIKTKQNVLEKNFIYQIDQVS